MTSEAGSDGGPATVVVPVDDNGGAPPLNATVSVRMDDNRTRPPGALTP